MPTLHATLPTSSDGSVILASPDAKLKVLTELLRGAEWNFTKNRLEAPWELWASIRNLPDTWTLHESEGIKARLAEDAQRQDAHLKEAERLIRNFDLALQEQGLRLREYQKEGVRWLVTRKTGLLTDEMGLGKTVQALAAIPFWSSSIIVCPASLRYYWLREIERWRSDLAPRVLEGRGSFAWPGPNEVVIFSDAAMLDDPPATDVPVRLYADEAHAYKGDSQRTKRITALTGRIRAAGGSTFALSGTPLLNRPEELWTLAKAFGLARLAWGSIPAFKRAFEVVETPYGSTYGTPKPAAGEGLRRISLRRTRAQVLSELPEKTVTFLPVTLTKPLKRTLDKLEAGLADALNRWENDGTLPDFTAYSAARTQLAALKIEAVQDWLDSLEAAGEPVVLFSAHRAPLDAFKDRPGWAFITGDTPPARRADIVESFARGELVGVGGTIQAMGTGHTLTRACHVGFVDRRFTPGENEQAEDRLARLGQLRAVTVTVFLGDHPLERRVEQILEKKRKLTAATLGGHSGHCSSAPLSGKEGDPPA